MSNKRWKLRDLDTGYSKTSNRNPGQKQQKQWEITS